MTSSQQVVGRGTLDLVRRDPGLDDPTATARGVDRLLAEPSRLERFGAQPGSRYTIKRGDTLSAIAHAHGTTWQVLARLNGLAHPDRIQIGQQLRLPSSSTTTHVVRRGETLGAIAAANGTTVAALARANGIHDPNRIYEGQVLRIRDTGGHHSPRSTTHGTPPVPTQAPRPSEPTVAPTTPQGTRAVGNGTLTPDASSVRAAEIAERRAMGHGSQRACYAWVKDALLAGGATRHRLSGVPAKGAGPQLEANGFVNVLNRPGNTIRSPYDAPPGAVLVYGAAAGATDRNVKYGHIEIRTQNGFASDYFSARARTGPAENGLEGRGRVLIGVYIKPATGAQAAPVAPRAASPATPRPASAGRADVIARLGNVLSSGEGNYDSYNTGTVGQKGKVVHSYPHPAEGSVTNKTVNQILATETLSPYNEGRMFATGKYQTIIGTLRSAKAAMNLTGNEKYTPELQERVFREFLLEKAGGGKLAAFVRDGKGTIDDAQYAAAKEWASIAVPKGMKLQDGRVSDGMMSYYERAGQNHGNQSATRQLRALLTELAASR